MPLKKIEKKGGLDILPLYSRCLEPRLELGLLTSSSAEEQTYLAQLVLQGRVLSG